MVKQQQKERRKWPRAKRVLSIQHRLVSRNGKKRSGRWFLSTTEDMSLGGLAYLSEFEYRIGDCVELKVVMSGILDIYSGLSKVVRVEQNKTAVYFLTSVKFHGQASAKRSASTTRKSATKKRPAKRI